MPPRIAISATNPCHLYEMALELQRLGVLARYESGYPGWRLRPPVDFPLSAHSLHTVVVYSALRFVPSRFRPRDAALFRWQDAAFDRAVARNIPAADFLHAMPGQCLETFRAARALGIRCVLNHASGPVRDQLEAVRPEYEKYGLRGSAFHSFDAAYFGREEEEYRLADFHCVGSSLVRDQLAARGIDPATIWVVPYGADPALFHPGEAPSPTSFKIAYAGQVNLRKGFRILLEALAEPSVSRNWNLDVYGRVAPEMIVILREIDPVCPVAYHGAVARSRLADAFRESSVMVLPSFEDAFPLVVPQALACGIPCIVSDRVGSKDLIRHRENGSIFPVGDAVALREELRYWSERPGFLPAADLSWREPARRLATLSQAVLNS